MLIEILKKQLSAEVRTAVLRALKRNRDKDIKEPDVREDIADDVIMELMEMSDKMIASGKAMLGEANKIKKVKRIKPR